MKKIFLLSVVVTILTSCVVAPVNTPNNSGVTADARSTPTIFVRV